MVTDIWLCISSDKPKPNMDINGVLHSHKVGTSERMESCQSCEKWWVIMWSFIGNHWNWARQSEENGSLCKIYFWFTLRITYQRENLSQSDIVPLCRSIHVKERKILILWAMWGHLGRAHNFKTPFKGYNVVLWVDVTIGFRWGLGG